MEESVPRRWPIKSTGSVRLTHSGHTISTGPGSSSVRPCPGDRRKMEDAPVSKRIRVRPGDFVALPLPSGGYGYGRILEKLVAFYNLKSDEVASVETITASDVSFTTAVHVSAPSKGRWLIVGARPLELQFREPKKFFRKNPSGGGFLIYTSNPTPRSSYEEREASAEECSGLEPLLVWDHDQISQRLEDHLLGNKNRYVSYYLKQLELDEKVN